MNPKSVSDRFERDHSGNNFSKKEVPFGLLSESPYTFWSELVMDSCVSDYLLEIQSLDMSIGIRAWKRECWNYSEAFKTIHFFISLLQLDQSINLKLVS
jgi:hypothetical protein